MACLQLYTLEIGNVHPSSCKKQKIVKWRAHKLFSKGPLWPAPCYFKSKTRAISKQRRGINSLQGCPAHGRKNGIFVNVIWKATPIIQSCGTKTVNLIPGAALPTSKTLSSFLEPTGEDRSSCVMCRTCLCWLSASTAQHRWNVLPGHELEDHNTWIKQCRANPFHRDLLLQLLGRWSVSIRQSCPKLPNCLLSQTSHSIHIRRVECAKRTERLHLRCRSIRQGACLF